MITEALLRALQERMRKLTNTSAECALRGAECRAALERARLIDAAEAAQESEALSHSALLAEEISALRDHVDELLRRREDPVLVADLKEELSELEKKRTDLDRQIEILKSNRQRSLDHAVKELEIAEREHRKVADQAMRLREYIETLSHS
jgi:hypothetical protein